MWLFNSESLPTCLPALAVLQEAVSTRDPELVRLVLRYRDHQRTAKRLASIPVLLERLRQVGTTTPLSNPSSVFLKHGLTSKITQCKYVQIQINRSFERKSSYLEEAESR